MYLFDYQGKCIDANNHEKIGEQIEVPEIPSGDIVVTGNFQWISVGASMGVNTYYIALLGGDEAARGAMNLIRIMFKKEHKELDKTTVLRGLLFEQSGDTYTPEDLEEVGLKNTDYLNVMIVDHKGAHSEEIKVVCENIFSEAFSVEVDRNHMVLITQAKEDIHENLQAIISELNTELLIPAKASVGKAVGGFEMLHKSYKSAKTALMIGEKLGQEDSLYFYDQMMIYHLVSEIDEDARQRYFDDYGAVFKDLVRMRN